MWPPFLDLTQFTCHVIKCVAIWLTHPQLHCKLDHKPVKRIPLPSGMFIAKYCKRERWLTFLHIEGMTMLKIEINTNIRTISRFYRCVLLFFAQTEIYLVAVYSFFSNLLLGLVYSEFLLKDFPQISKHIHIFKRRSLYWIYLVLRDPWSDCC